ncbi:MAG: FAD-binding oxidoreductase [Trueperaceae bacterium]|nr:FAD-binding oxidoreductase [Trueperaceae bacterium]
MPGTPGSDSRRPDAAVLRAALERDLRASLAGEVRFDPVTRSLYATDASPYRIAPHGVVFPQHADDLRATLAVARAHGAPILMRGGGTSLAGQTVGEAIVVDTTRHLTDILEIDAEERVVRVQPGVVRDQLNARLAPLGLQFTPDVSTSDRAAIGGMVANDSAGTRSIKYGKTVDQVIAMTVLLADGTVTELRAMGGVELERKRRSGGVEGEAYRTVHRIVHEHEAEIRARTPKVMRRVAGYHLDELLPGRPFNLAKLVCGSEGTLAAILDVTLALHPVPRRRVLALLHFDALVAALEAVPAIVAHGPSAVELIDRDMFELAAGNPALSPHIGWVRGDPAAVLSVEFDGDDDAELAAHLEALAADPAAGGRAYATYLATDAAAQREVIEFRKQGLGIYATVPGAAKPTPFIEDAAIPIEHLAAYVPQVLEICHRHGARAVLYGHASVGVLHVRPLLDLKSAAGVAAYRAIADETFALVQRYGGSWSGEHGDGLIRSEKIREAFGETVYQAFVDVKRAFDPENVWNPGKIVDAPAMTGHLRYGVGYPAVDVPTVFDFGPEGFLGAAEACTGVGACRKEGVGTMCPSYMATRDEAHSTRGRANALREAINGGLPGGLTSREVHDVLDLCLECKACKAECPSRVDVGKLKAEFLQAYYDAHGTPLAARAQGGAAKLAPLAQSFAPLLNALLPLAPVRWLTEKTIGIDRRRTLPAYAPRRFDRAFRARAGAPGTATPPTGTAARAPSATSAAPTVALFVDTWSNFHDTAPAHAAVAVLEAVGARVELVPYRCCGRPLISKGLLREAKAQAAANVAALTPYVERGVPVLGLEPSCVSAFTDDYPSLVPGPATDALARHVRPLEAWLAKLWSDGGLRPEALFEPSDEPVLLHGHCQQKAVLGTAATRSVLGWASRDVRELDAGCCGMAGSFGYTHHELSLAIGEQRLFPAVRAHAGEVVACGFSCRHQLADAIGRRPRHVAEALAGALRAHALRARG